MMISSQAGICQDPAVKMGESITATRFFSSVIGTGNQVWFLTESGLVSFDGQKWSLHDQNASIPANDLNSIAFNSTATGGELLISTKKGILIAVLPISSGSKVETWLPDNSSIKGENVVSAVSGKGNTKWFGTDKGVFAIKDNQWLTNSYGTNYPENLFEYFPITSMATSPSGDTLYAATSGAGVMRVVRNEVDAVSGASEYAEWGPIIMPSDNVLCIWITPDGTQWLGTDKGIAQHTGYETLENWTVFNTESGLVENTVQCIRNDSKGNIWFGTAGGASVFDGKQWKSYKTEDGLAGNNVLTISIDSNDVVWFGTDNGVSSFSNGKFVSYR
jgi:ligand-binding sensor domain-containing protein